MKRLFIVLAVLALTMTIVTPAFAKKAETCLHEPTIASLRECVLHARQMGAITSDGILQSLLADLDAARAALDRGNETAAINTLQAFVLEVNAQAGKGIDAEHAQHFVMHAQEVIAALSQ